MIVYNQNDANDIRIKTLEKVLDELRNENLQNLIKIDNLKKENEYYEKKYNGHNLYRDSYRRRIMELLAQIKGIDKSMDVIRAEIENIIIENIKKRTGTLPMFEN